MDDSLIQIERQVSALRPKNVPDELRDVVLWETSRELRAARWDRRLVRFAAVLLAVGVGLNLATGLRTTGSDRSQRPRFAQSSSPQSLIDTAIVVAEATDAATGSRFARQMAAMSGLDLTADEAAAIDAAVERATSNNTPNGHKG